MPKSSTVFTFPVFAEEGGGGGNFHGWQTISVVIWEEHYTEIQVMTMKSQNTTRRWAEVHYTGKHSGVKYLLIYC